MGVAIEGRNRELIEAPNLCHVSTLRSDGSQHTVFVWVDIDGDEILLNTAIGRAWYNNVLRDSRITLLIAGRDNPYEYVTVRGRVVNSGPEGAEDHIDHLSKKYLDLDEYPYRLPGEERVLVRIEPDWVHHVGARSD